MCPYRRCVALSILSIQQAINYASQVGFAGSSQNSPLVIIVSIAEAESGLDTNATHVDADGSIDRGILQINNRAHPEVSAGSALNPFTAFAAGYHISNGGT